MENEMGTWSSEDAVVSDVCVVNGGGGLFKLLANINRDNTVPETRFMGKLEFLFLKKKQSSIFPTRHKHEILAHPFKQTAALPQEGARSGEPFQSDTFRKHII